ncbi:MAG TPA: glutamine--fructose-6-phosphate transaminase (isomerizing) [Pirellulaceae bacterium]|jgi:glucosamine--fructose-6-phosphate aminotransferase (isomerizing)|nr:glutamine--fructose-6-phosphate transaminase (isomerizing) [Pirellulaceae bacterium]
MCGIVGYVGPGKATEFLLEGLRRLEYRGYDSCGVATLSKKSGWSLVKQVGRIAGLAEKIHDSPIGGRTGVGHTRWATHGPATEPNAHPHVGGDGRLVVVHNGVIENYQKLKARLQGEGYVFRSATDTEVIAHLIDSCWNRLELDAAEAKHEIASGNGAAHDPTDLLVEAVRCALKQLRGTYGLAVMFRDYPDAIVAARLGSPLVVGVGDGEHYLASDGSPLVGYTDKIVYLADSQIAVITADALRVLHLEEGHVDHLVEKLELQAQDVELGPYPHYMLKEIFEQPESLRNGMRGRLSFEDASARFGGLNLTPQQLRGVNKIILTACGTSWHAALVGEYLIEKIARIPVEVEYASELRYRNPPVEPGTLIFAITQSGETLDTLAAMREMKRKGHPTLAICNVVGSTIAKEADGGIFLHAGPEIGVASTKAYTSQVLVLTLLALYLGRLRHLGYDEGTHILKTLERVPGYVEKALLTDSECRRIAAKYLHATNILYLGRQLNFPTALEGALKLKEISYVHAEGYPAAEMKHGPIALVDEETPSLFIMPHSAVYEKVVANVEEIKARGGPVIAVVEEGDTQIRRLADDVIEIPRVDEIVQPLVSIVPLQLLAYHIATLKNRDVDKPRNLAKSVTVE